MCPSALFFVYLRKQISYMANHNFKGRPKGSNKIKITDPSLKNYHITQDEWSYNLIRENDNSETIMGYYPTLADTLISANRYLQLDGGETTLDNYINKINNKLDEFRSIV
jgi:hypothetical protein